MNATNVITHQLGRPLKEYRRSGKAFLKIALLSLFSGVIAAFIFHGAFTARGIDLAGKIVLSIVGSLFLLPAFAGIYMLVTRRASSFGAYENGFIYRYGKKEFAVRWEDIASIAESSACRIELNNGDGFDIGNNVEGFSEIAEDIRNETLRRMLPRMQQRIADGGSVTFQGMKLGGTTPLSKAVNNTLLKDDGFIVDAKGIGTVPGGSRISWEDVVEYGVRPGEGRLARFSYFYIRDPQKEFQMNYATLQNAHVLLEICAERAPQANEESN
ncbi:MAG: DUF6585 family protein [bacterium]